MALLSCKELALGYGSAKIAESISFSLKRGEHLCIVGENGSGKSTLMKTCLGMLHPLSGSIVLSDGLKPSEIGYLPQQATVERDFPASCWEIVLSGCLNQCGLRPFYSREQKRRAAEHMQRLGISHLAGRCYGELSGGQQQRVLLARALCATTRLLLLDEPTGGLDPEATDQLYRLIEQLHQDGIAIMMITHDIPAALRYATHILHLDGRGAYWGTTQEYRLWNKEVS